MQKSFVFVSLLLMLSGIFMGACRKEDLLPPDVRFLSPAGMSAYTIGDTVFVRAKITADRDLIKVSLSLVDPLGRKVQHEVDFSPGTKEFLLDIAYPLYDINMETATYDLLILADDGEETKKKYLPIRIDGIPQAHLGYLIMVRQSFDRKNLYRISAGLDIQRIDTFPGDHKGSAYIAAKQNFAICGKTFGPLLMYNLMANSVIWSVPSVPDPPVPYFTCINATDNRLIIGFYEGFLKIYSYTGTVEATIQIDQARIPHYAAIFGDKIIVDEASRFGPEHYLNIYHYPSGTISQLVYPGMETVAIVPGPSGVVWFGNTNGIGKIIFLDPETGSTWEPAQLSTNNIFSVTYRDPSNILISTSQGIQWFRPAQLSLVDYLPGMAAQHLSFDKMNDRLLASKGNDCSIISFPDGSLLGTLQMNDSIFEAWPWYNK